MGGPEFDSTSPASRMKRLRAAGLPRHHEKTPTDLGFAFILSSIVGYWRCHDTHICCRLKAPKSANSPPPSGYPGGLNGHTVGILRHQRIEGRQNDAHQFDRRPIRGPITNLRRASSKATVLTRLLTMWAMGDQLQLRHCLL